ncbi:MAG TPA: tetratricopeptide repeat protein [Gammaproteobacteria bacterium]|nr:tetratricopeptide repeat protein [Gammaproteobacteria bacterium]
MFKPPRSFSNPSLFRYILLLLASFSLLLPAAAMASASKDFNRGISYFKHAQYDRAIQSFEQARKKGLKKPALYYNLGVSYFKTRNYDQASYYFKKILRFKKLRSLAEYNLGLVALKKNDHKSARKWFNKSRASNNPKISRLSERQLKRLSYKKLSRRSIKKWYSSASLSYGNNSNIKLVPAEIATDTSDSFTELYASTSGILSGNYTDGISLNGFAYFINYANINAYDEKQARLGLYKSKKYAAWRTRIGAYYERSTFGSNPYQQVTGLEAKGKYKFQKSKYISLRYRYNNIKSLYSPYDYLQGSRQQFRTEYLNYSASASKIIYYEMEVNNRQNLSTRNYSPTRHTLRAVYYYNLTKAWRIGGELSYRYSKYQPTATQNRQDDRLRAAIAAKYRLNKHWKINGRYQRTDNSSTDSLYTYVQNLYSVGIAASF